MIRANSAATMIGISTEIRRAASQISAVIAATNASLARVYSARFTASLRPGRAVDWDDAPSGRVESLT